MKICTKKQSLKMDFLIKEKAQTPWKLKALSFSIISDWF